MNRDEQLACLLNGPTNLYQRALLLTLVIMADDHCIAPVSQQDILNSIDIPVRNTVRTLNELIKKGWIEPLPDDAYRINPYINAGLQAAFKGLSTFRDTQNNLPTPDRATENKERREW